VDPRFRGDDGSESDFPSRFAKVVDWIDASHQPTCDAMRDRIPCVYILASAERGTLYIGVTSDLPGRLWQHRNDVVSGFSNRYQVHRLVWYEVHGEMESAILREKRIKKWNRAWKLELIESTNPGWRDLASDIL
jgi:putative endonuclease